MSRSSRFGSAPCNSIALLRLAFASATPNGLTLLQSATRRLIKQKARGHTVIERTRLHGAPTACKRTVLVSISLPSPGFFSPFPHGTGSLSVASKYSALEDGPPRFTRGYTCPALLGYPLQRDRQHFAYGTITPYGGPFQDPSAMCLFDDSPGYALREPHNPATACSYGLGYSRFARRYYGNLF